MATATLDDHVFVFFKYDVALIEEIEHRDRRQFGGSATGFWHFSRTHEMHQCLNNCMIGCVHVGI